MLGTLRKHAQELSEVQRTDQATVAASNGGAYTLSYRGTTVGPVWSVSGLVYAVGQSVTVVLEGKVIKGIVP